MWIIALCPLLIPFVMEAIYMRRSAKDAALYRAYFESDEYKRRIRDMAAAHLLSWGFVDQANEMLRKDNPS